MAFGFTQVLGKSFWDKTKIDSKKPKASFALPASDDGASIVGEGGVYGTYLDLDGATRNENALIERYRDIAQYPDCESAIDDIITEAIVATEDDVPVTVNTDNVDMPKGIREKIDQEFKNICTLLDFNRKGFDIFRRWYIDGRIYYHKIIDESRPKLGILELRYLDPRKTRKVRTVDAKTDGMGNILYSTAREFYIYNDVTSVQGNMSALANSTEIAPQGIACATSGIIDLDKNLILGYLQKAIRPVNHLRIMEDALVINRVSRAPDRRMFLVDVTGMNKIKGEAHIKDLMSRYKNKVVYNSATGEVMDTKKHMAMTEDYWMPVNSAGRGTTVTNLPGLSSNSTIEDVQLFQEKLNKALNIPLSRLQPGGGGFGGFGRVAEITRDEIQFAKFIDRLRKRFSSLFDDLLKTQLILKGVITADDWDTIKTSIQYRFINDTSIAEMRTIESLRDKMNMIAEMQQSNFIGTYMSKTTVMKDILKMSEDEIELEQQQIIAEMQSPVLNNQTREN